MTDAPDDQRDFFISFNQADRALAEWIAYVLDENGYPVWFQHWDFRHNWVAHMDEAHRQSRRTLLVLSDHFLDSRNTRQEWTARFAQDPDRLVLVKVGPVGDAGLLAPDLYVDLTGCEEGEAERRLLEYVKLKTDPTFRAKPAKRPSFTRLIPERPAFATTILHNLPPPNPDFVGRKKVLGELRRLLKADQPIVLAQAITGLGGIGKSQTALAYCHQHKADYTLVAWLRAEEPTLAATYAAMAPRLGLQEQPEQAAQIAAVRAKLEVTKGWLLVFDNAEEPMLLRPYLPAGGQGCVLLTARRRDWGGLARMLPLDIMTEPEALELLAGTKTWAARSDLAEAKALADELGYLPLALAQAHSYFRERGTTFGGYRRLLREARLKLLERGLDESLYPKSVARTWEVSLSAAEARSQAARPLLELLSFFAPNPLPKPVLTAAPWAMPRALHDPLDLDDAIAALTGFSLAAAGEGTLTIHRLVQAVTRDGLDEATAKTRAAAAVQLVKAALPWPPWEHTNWLAMGALLPHALAAADAAERLGAGLEAVAGVLNGTALYHWARAAWAEAELLYQRAIAIGEKTLGPEHPDFKNWLHNLAVLYQATGRYAQAEPLYERAIAIGEKALGPEHPTLATWLSNLAELYRATGRDAQAEPLYECAIAIGEKALGPEHPTLATWLSNLAELYRATGRYAQAEPLYERALAIGEKALGPEHPTLAIWLNNLAELYRDTGRDAQAEPLYERALAISEKALGPEHPTLATRLSNLAELYRATGRYAQAEPLYERALAIGEKALGPEHPTLAIWLNNLAVLYRDTGRDAQAEPLYERALAISEKALGPEHPTLATRLNNLAVLYRDTGRDAQAEPLYQRAIAIGEKALGPEHPTLATSLNNLAGLYQATGRYAQAEPLYERAIAIGDKALGPEHPTLATRLSNLANLYRATGRDAQAEPLSKRALAIREKALGPNHSNVAQSLSNLALLYQDTRRYAEAEPLFERALAISEKTLGPEHPDVGILYGNLAGIYEATARYVDAEPLRLRSLEIHEKALGKDHPHISRGLNNLAGLYQVTGRWAEAEPLYKRAIAAGEKALGPEHPELVAQLNNLALLYQDTRRYAEAEPLLARAVAILERSLPPDHPHLMGVLENQAGLLEELDRGGEAAELRARADAIRQRREQGRQLPPPSS